MHVFGILLSLACVWYISYISGAHLAATFLIRNACFRLSLMSYLYSIAYIWFNSIAELARPPAQTVLCNKVELHLGHAGVCQGTAYQHTGTFSSTVPCECSLLTLL